MLKSRVLRGMVCAGLVTAALGAGVKSADASILMITSASQYASESFSIATIQFDGLLANQSGDVFAGDPGVLGVGGVNFTTPAGTDLFLIGPGAVDGAGHSFNFPGNGSVTLDPEHGTPSVVKATLPVFPSGVTAVGSDIGGFYSTANMTITVTTTSNVYTFPYTAQEAHTSGLGFLGFISPDNEVISSVAYSDPTPDDSTFTNIVMDNFTYGLANPAGSGSPEPASLGILALGVMGMMVRRRRV